MEIRVEKGSAEKYSYGLLLLFSFETPGRLEGPLEKVDRAWKGFITNLIKQGDFKGELFQCQLIYTQGALPGRGKNLI